MVVQGRVAKYVKEMGIKQNVIASKTGLYEQTVSMILNCKRRMSADEFVRICKAIGKEPNDFMEETENAEM